MTDTSFSSFIKSLTFSECCSGIKHGLYFSRAHLFNSYFLIPAGLIIIFTILYGLNVLLTQTIKITFPSSVLGMLINLVLLCILNILANLNTLKNNWVSKVASTSTFIFDNYLRIIKPPMNFTLKWINVFFIPSFIILPLSDAITFIECLKIAGVFLFGFLLLFCVDVYMILGLQWLLRNFGLLKHENEEGNLNLAQSIELKDFSKLSLQEDIEVTQEPEARGGVFTSMRDDITTIELNKKIEASKTQESFDRRLSSENPFDSEIISQPEKVYLRDGRTSILPSTAASSNPPTGTLTPISADESAEDEESQSIPPSLTTTKSETTKETIMKGLSPNTQRITIFLTNYIDWILYTVLFIVSLPLYYITSIHTFLPYHLGVTIISFYIALLIPQKFPALKKVAHPILILTAEILFVLFIGSLIYHKGQPKGFIDDLKYYKTGKNYLNLFNDKVLAESGKLVGINELPQDDRTGTPMWPGCGDVLSSLMDISIVSLLLPMFTHRKDFTRNFWVLMPPLLVSIALTFFCYPLFCYHIGIAPTRAIGFIGRSVTLALGTPLITSLDGSVSLMACCTILSGICGVLVGDQLFKFLRVPKNDYVTRGVSLGINCGAIATAHLLNVDPRAALMSSLAFSVFGTIMVIMAAIVSVKDTINSWVGL